jgi:hypothetical protein
MTLSACAGYKLSGREKEAVVDQISPDIFTVNFCGNAYMTQSEAEKYALQRASEAVLSKGYAYFVVLDKRDDSELCELKPAPGAGATQPLSQSSELFSDMPSDFVRPNVTLKVKGFTRLGGMPEKSIDAEQFLRENFPGLNR